MSIRDYSRRLFCHIKWCGLRCNPSCLYSSTDNGLLTPFMPTKYHHFACFCLSTHMYVLFMCLQARIQKVLLEGVQLWQFFCLFFDEERVDGRGLFCSCFCMCVQLEMHRPENTNNFTDVWALTCTTFHFIFNCFFIGWKICMFTYGSGEINKQTHSWNI